MERIRQLRKERGLSQAKLAVMADMDPATLNRLERGTGNPNLKTLDRVADALGVEVADFFPKARRRSSPEEPTLLNWFEDERRRTELAKWLEERCGHAYLALPKGEFEEIFDRIPEDAPERRELALKINREYNVFCDFPRNVTPAERLSMRRMIRAAIPEVAVKHGIALMEGGLSREYQEEAARIFEVQSATENATA
jgi:transcriptional regulator with XRE-family HTH domain